jgi:hypothetical protein
MTPRFVQANVMTNWNRETEYMVTTRGGSSGLQEISGITGTTPFSVSLTRAPLFSDGVTIMRVQWMCSENKNIFTDIYFIFYNVELFRKAHFSFGSWSSISVLWLQCQLSCSKRKQRTDRRTDIKMFSPFAILSWMGLECMYILKRYHILRVYKCYHLP